MKQTDWRQNRYRVKKVLQAEESQGEVFVQGWLRTVRASKGVAFLALNDGSCLDNVYSVT